MVNNLLFSKKNLIIDAELISKRFPQNDDFLKTKLRWSKLSWLLQRVAFLVTFVTSLFRHKNS